MQPSLIRVDADEVTYNLHILIRFELERAMIEDDLQVADLPAAWREKYQQYLGITPPNDADGALQDVHWSAGLFGYFPTYSLGNLYAAQFFAQANADLGDLPAAFRRGEFAPLLGWLRENIHRHGQRYAAAELVAARHRPAAVARGLDRPDAGQIRRTVRPVDGSAGAASGEIATSARGRTIARLFSGRRTSKTLGRRASNSGALLTARRGHVRRNMATQRSGHGAPRVCGRISPLGVSVTHDHPTTIAVCPRCQSQLALPGGGAG